MIEDYKVPKCPNCNSTNVSEYVNGLPDMIAINEYENLGHKFIYKGCILDGTEMDYRCNSCSKDFLDLSTSNALSSGIDIII